MYNNSGGGGFGCLIAGVVVVLVVALAVVALTAGTHNTAVTWGDGDHTVTQAGRDAAGGGGTWADGLTAATWSFLIVTVVLMGVIGFVAALVGGGGRR